MIAHPATYTTIVKLIVRINTHNNKRGQQRHKPADCRHVNCCSTLVIPNSQVGPMMYQCIHTLFMSIGCLEGGKKKNNKSRLSTLSLPIGFLWFWLDSAKIWNFRIISTTYYNIIINKDNLTTVYINLMGTQWAKWKNQIDV